MKDTILLGIMVLSTIGCPYQGIGDSGADLGTLKEYDMNCNNSMMLEFETKGIATDMSYNNQGNGKRCSLDMNGQVSWSSVEGSDASGSCQYLIGLNLVNSVPCDSSQYYFNYTATASWLGGAPVNISGAAVRVFVRDENGKFLGSKSANLENNMKKAQCIQLSTRPASRGGISALLVLTLNPSSGAADAGMVLPSLGISDARLTTLRPSGSVKCELLEPL